MLIADFARKIAPWIYLGIGRWRIASGLLTLALAP